MNQIILKKYKINDSLAPHDAQIVYKKCSNCGQIICDTEFAYSIFITDKCPSCNIMFTSPNEQKYHKYMKSVLQEFLEK